MSFFSQKLRRQFKRDLRNKTSIKPVERTGNRAFMAGQDKRAAATLKTYHLDRIWIRL